MRDYGGQKTIRRTGMVHIILVKSAEEVFQGCILTCIDSGVLDVYIRFKLQQKNERFFAYL